MRYTVLLLLCGMLHVIQAFSRTPYPCSSLASQQDASVHTRDTCVHTIQAFSRTQYPCMLRQQDGARAHAQTHDKSVHISMRKLAYDQYRRRQSIHDTQDIHAQSALNTKVSNTANSGVALYACRFPGFVMRIRGGKRHRNSDHKNARSTIHAEHGEERHMVDATAATATTEVLSKSDVFPLQQCTIAGYSCAACCPRSPAALLEKEFGPDWKSRNLLDFRN